MATRRRKPPRTRIPKPETRRRRILGPRSDVERELLDAWVLVIDAVEEALVDELLRQTIKVADLIRLDAARTPVEKTRALFSVYVPRGVVENVENAVGKLGKQVDADLRKVPGIDPTKLLRGGKRTIDRLRDEGIRQVRDATTKQIATLAKIVEANRGEHAATLVEKIRTATAVSKKKAELWARDQTLKLHARITEERHKDLGISEYVWTTSGDERVRDFHDELNGQTFSWDDPPITNPQGDRNHPGEDYQCRCIAYPVIVGANELA